MAEVLSSIISTKHWVKHCEKKPIVHELNEKNIAKRRERAGGLLELISGDNLKKVITTDEKWFTFRGGKGQRKVQYADRGQTRDQLNLYEEDNKKTIGVMVWAGICWEGKTTLQFVKPGAKINSTYYCEEIITKFLNKDAKRLYPNGDYLFQQDGATSHTSRVTTSFLRSHMNFISKDQWPPKSCDLAPMDYSIWSWMQREVAKEFSDMSSFKKAILRVWSRLPLAIIRTTLESWPKRVKAMMKNKGRHI